MLLPPATGGGTDSRLTDGGDAGVASAYDDAQIDPHNGQISTTIKKTDGQKSRTSGSGCSFGSSSISSSLRHIVFIKRNNNKQITLRRENVIVCKHQLAHYFLLSYRLLRNSASTFQACGESADLPYRPQPFLRLFVCVRGCLITY